MPGTLVAMSDTAATGRQAIVRAVYDAVLADGFGQLRVRQLAECAGVSSGLIHHYWPNLDALVVEAFELFAAEFAESIRLAINPRDEPRRQLRDLVATLIPDGEVPEVSVWLEAACQARRQPALAPAVGATNADTVELVRAIIVQGNDLDRWHVEDSLAVAQELLALIDGLAFHSLVVDTMTPATARASATAESTRCSRHPLGPVERCQGGAAARQGARSGLLGEYLHHGFGDSRRREAEPLLELGDGG